MRSLITLLIINFFGFAAAAQTTVSKTTTPDPSLPIQTAEVSCGKCKLGLPGKTCEMAIRFDGKAYYVDGAGIDNFGDAHAHDGMCNAIRKADVQGQLVNNRFKVSYINVLPEIKKEGN
ncbi:MAG: DUF6370 family protein [Ferruginibacter sp.]